MTESRGGQSGFGYLRFLALFILLFAGFASGILWVERASAQALTTERVCEILGMDTTDCTAISNVSANAWTTGNSEPRLDGEYLVSANGSSSTLSSCLKVHIGEGALSANTRIDFEWRMNAGAGGFLRFYINSTQTAVHNGTEGWHRQQRLANTGVTVLSWCFEGSSEGSGSAGFGAVDRLNFEPGTNAPLIADNAALCEVLDIATANCPALHSFRQIPPSLPWRISTEQSSFGASALQIPLTVLSGERACLELAVDIGAGESLSFNWRNTSANASQLSFLIDDSELSSLSGAGSDSGWNFFTHTTNAAIDSLSWCYRRSTAVDDSGQAWIDNLAIGPQVIIQRISTPVLVQVQQNRLTYHFELKLENTGNTVLTANRYALDLAIVDHSADHIIRSSSISGQQAEGTGLLLTAAVILELVNLVSTITWDELTITGLPSTAHNLPPIIAAVPLKSVLCAVLELSAADCVLIAAVENSGYPWQISEEGAFSGPGLQSSPNLPAGAFSSLMLSLSPAVAAVEFYRRVSSERFWDWLIFEYNNIQRGDQQFSNFSYWVQPFFDADGLVHGDISGIDGGYSFGDFSDASGTVRLGADANWSLLRLLPNTPFTISRLRWIYRKSFLGLSAGADRGWIDRLQLYPSLNMPAQLCSALDLDEGSCPITALTLLPRTYQWSVDDEPNLRATGGSALRAPFRVNPGQTSCLTATVDLKPSLLRFRWRANQAAHAQLSFRVNGSEIATLTGSPDADWKEVVHTVTSDITSLAWCYNQILVSNRLSQSWIDALSLIPLVKARTRIGSVSTPTQLHSDGSDTIFRFVIVLNDLTSALIPVFTPQLQLAVDPSTELRGHSYSVETTYTRTDNARQFIYAVTANMNIPIFVEPELYISFTTTISVDEIWSIHLPVAEFHRQRLCSILELNTTDCALLSAFSSSADFPWQAATADFQSGTALLASNDNLPTDVNSCLTLEFSSDYDSIERIDFTWAIDSDANHLRLSVNEQPLAFNSGLLASAPHERQQRLLPDPLTRLDWCYINNAGSSAGEGRGWLDDLSFHRRPTAPLLPADRPSLCVVLDLDSDSCELVQGFGQRHLGNGSEGLSWALTTGAQSVTGGSALRSPLTVPETAESCFVLTLAVELPARTQLQFQWRVDSAQNTDWLQFFAGNSLLDSISGQLADNPWSPVSHTLTRGTEQLLWCFGDNGSASAGSSLGWIDHLQLLPPEPRFAIALVTTATAQPTLGRYHFTVTARDNNRGFRAAMASEQLLLATIQHDNIAAYTLTSTLSDNGDKLFALTIQLQAVNTAGSLTVSLRHVEPNLLAVAGSTHHISFAALDVSQSICTPLGLSIRDCAFISSFSTTAGFPWQVMAAGAFASGENLLASADNVADGDESCLLLTLTEQALTAGSRIDFRWAVDAAVGDHLQFAVNDIDIARIDGVAIPGHRQQRFSNTAVNSLNWCYRKDSAGSTGEDRGWLNTLNFQPGPEASLLADQQALCTALDLSAADCAALSAYTQSPASLSWGVTRDIALQGVSSLQNPATVTSGESSCLKLHTDLPPDTTINFAWRVDSAHSSALSFEVNDIAVAGLSIQGAVAGVANNGWQMQSYRHETALSSLGWCYRRGASFRGMERGWLDLLRLEPAFIYPLITLETTPTRADNDSPWIFALRVSMPTDKDLLPPGLQLILALGNNLSTIAITVESQNERMIALRVEAVVEADNNTTIMRFGFGALPAAVEPFADGLTVVIEPELLALIIPVLQMLADDGPTTDNGISLNDLLTGLRLLSSNDSSALRINLPGFQGASGDSTNAFTAVINNPLQQKVLDVDGNGTVDTIDFRLMVRYYSGLRGTALCDEVCRIKLYSLLEP